MHDEVEVIPHTFKIANEVDKHRVILGLTFALAKTRDVLGDEFSSHGVDFFFQIVRIFDKFRPIFQNDLFDEFILFMKRLVHDFELGVDPLGEGEIFTHEKRGHIHQNFGKRQEQNRTNYVKEGMEHGDLLFGIAKPFHKRYLIEI